jgi:hypothetical protein
MNPMILAMFAAGEYMDLSLNKGSDIFARE